METSRIQWEQNERCGTYLAGHIVVAGAVKVVVGPAGEGVLLELVRGAVVLEGELRVGLEELALLHLLKLTTIDEDSRLVAFISINPVCDRSGLLPDLPAPPTVPPIS